MICSDDFEDVIAGPSQKKKPFIESDNENSSDGEFSPVKSRKRSFSKSFNVGGDSSEDENVDQICQKNNSFTNSISSNSEHQSDSDSSTTKKSYTKAKRNPKSSEKKQRLNELEKLKNKRNNKGSKLDFGGNEDKDENNESEFEIIESTSESDSSNDFEKSGENESINGQSYTSDYENDRTNDDSSSEDTSESSDESENSDNEQKEDWRQIISQLNRSSCSNEAYFESASKRQLKRTPNKSAKKKETPKDADPEVFQRLIKNLKQHVVGDVKKLKDFDIIEQFEIVGSDVDESRSESCVCGKDQLKYLYYIKNKKLRENEDDFVEYATTTLIIGSECIRHWYLTKHKARKDKNKTAKPIESEFMKFLEKGVIGNFRRELKNAGPKKHLWIITISSELLTKNSKVAKQEYKLKLKKGKNNAVDLTITVEEKVLKEIKKSYNFKLKKDSRHRFFLKLDFEEKSKALHFYLQDLQNPESKVFRSSEPTTGKDFLK